MSEENDHLDTYLEIHAGAGGTESQDWAQMLRRMYSKWIDKKKCKFVPIDGRFVKRQIDLGNFDQLKNYVSSNIVNYIKKNMKV